MRLHIITWSPKLKNIETQTRTRKAALSQRPQDRRNDDSYFSTTVEILRASESLYRQVVLGTVARWAEVIIYSKKGEEFLRGKTQKEKRWSSPHGGDLENKGMLRVESSK